MLPRTSSISVMCFLEMSRIPVTVTFRSPGWSCHRGFHQWVLGTKVTQLPRMSPAINQPFNYWCEEHRTHDGMPCGSHVYISPTYRQTWPRLWARQTKWSIDWDSFGGHEYMYIIVLVSCMTRWNHTCKPLNNIIPFCDVCILPYIYVYVDCLEVPGSVK